MGAIIEVKVPDIGDFKDVPVIEVNVKPGDTVKAEDSLVTLESDKATMDIPAPCAGTVKELKLKVGDKVAEGVLVLLLETAADKPAAAAAAPASPAPPATPVATPPAASRAALPAGEESADVCVLRPTADEPLGAPGKVYMPTPAEIQGASKPHASPSVRHFARELGVDVAQVKGSGPKGRITQQDVQAYVKGALAGATATVAAAASGSGTGLDLLPWPKVDFAKFGPVESRPLSRIQKISGANLLRNWVMIPHVTQFDEADITDLEAFRVAMNKEHEKSATLGGLKLTMLAFLIKGSVAALKKFPTFNASLDGDNLVLKNYFHIGFAADTPNGLVVPVLRDADRKGVFDIAREMGELAKKARDGKLGPAEMQGGCFSISSLGGIGGTAFTPIINAPEVAILGVSKTQTKPVWNGKEFLPRALLPLSLSYDHRVIDGASAARFTAYLGQVLADMRRILL
ncbi:MAG: dihydrolipoyllysine-residue acetyltransferase [Proteobacteria bacterium]|nr:dihydrolipoyllysine-residue acetyltransferase [Pseudomonadota bacterium]